MWSACQPSSGSRCRTALPGSIGDAAAAPSATLAVAPGSASQPRMHCRKPQQLQHEKVKRAALATRLQVGRAVGVGRSASPSRPCRSTIAAHSDVSRPVAVIPDITIEAVVALQTGELTGAIVDAVEGNSAYVGPRLAPACELQTERPSLCILSTRGNKI